MRSERCEGFDSRPVGALEHGKKIEWRHVRCQRVAAEGSELCRYHQLQVRIQALREAKKIFGQKVGQ